MAGLLNGKAMAPCTALTPEDAIQYDKVKEAILRRYEINEETYRQRQDRKKSEESYREYADRLGDHFTRWVDSQAVPYLFLSITMLLYYYMRLCSLFFPECTSLPCARHQKRPI